MCRHVLLLHLSVAVSGARRSCSSYLVKKRWVLIDATDIGTCKTCNSSSRSWALYRCINCAGIWDCITNGVDYDGFFFNGVIVDYDGFFSSFYFLKKKEMFTCYCVKQCLRCTTNGVIVDYDSFFSSFSFSFFFLKRRCSHATV